jgi:predicted enzyme related to lactoylglutathione lyase
MTMADKVVHFEVIGRDAARSQAFYAELFDWKIDASNPMQYGLVAAQPGGIGGGIAGSPTGPRVTVYVEVADLFAALARAQSLGGKTLLEPDQVPGGPRIALFADPDGNTIGLIQAGTR